MKLTHTFAAMVLLVTLSMIFYFSLNMEKTHSHMPGQENILKQDNLEVHSDDVRTEATIQETSSLSDSDFQSVSVSGNFRESIPQNQAYWNRLLYIALNELDKGRNPFIHSSNWSYCGERSQELLQTNVHDFASYPVLFQNFLRVMNCRSPPVLLNQPNKCIYSKREGANESFLLFVIKSSPWNFVRRQAVRETWGKERVYQGGLGVRRVFLLGTTQPSDPDISELLSFEAKHFGDLLQWDFHESLLNLTLKMNMFLHWTLKYCSHVSFVFSGDDDVFVNTPALLSYLQSLDPSKASQLYVGQVIGTASPLRDPKSKYYVPLSFYDGPYPAYAGGGGFVMSTALLKPLYLLGKIIPFFPIDDVYVGMCFKALGVSPEAHQGFQTFDVREQDRNNLCVYKDLILIHQRSPSEIIRLWKGIHSPLLTC